MRRLAFITIEIDGMVKTRSMKMDCLRSHNKRQCRYEILDMFTEMLDEDFFEEKDGKLVCKAHPKS